MATNTLPAASGARRKKQHGATPVERLLWLGAAGGVLLWVVRSRYWVPVWRALAPHFGLQP